ncbi:hypothetical protein V3C99_009043 [Haemonchus contortus]|uniref:Major capsid protein n=1 Tax=Haemonchus contortus TaxID=6289 RepID=A0A7I5EAR5_HAECO
MPLRKKTDPAEIVSTVIPATTFYHINAVPPARHVVIGTTEVDNDMAAVLNLEPSFAITLRVNNQVVDAGVHPFAYQLRWKTHCEPTVLEQQGL